MEITLTPLQESAIRRALESGRYQRPEDAVAEALLIWEERETQRTEFLARLNAAEASLDRGDSLPVTQDSMRALAEEVKRRGRELLTVQRRRRD